jgi:hypothetical protein
MNMQPFDLPGADGKRLKGDRAEGSARQILFITRVSVQAMG